jgi:hypothetical protein
MTPEDLVAELAAFRSAEAPVPGAALRDLFASGAVVVAPARPAPARRTPMSMPKRLLAAVPSKIAAGVVGALLAGSLGAGAMTGTLSLTSQESDAPAEVVEPQDAVEVAPAEVEADDADEAEVAEVADDVEAAEAPKEDAGDPTTAPEPTSVDEAAHNHQFDEACGNHGAYVSHFARTGEEPECALNARAGGEVTDPAAAASADEVAPSDDAADEPADAEQHGKGQGQAKAEAKAKKAGKSTGASKAKGGHRQA